MHSNVTNRHNERVPNLQISVKETRLQLLTLGLSIDVNTHGYPLMREPVVLWIIFLSKMILCVT